MALFEAGDFDERSGRMANASLGESRLPVHADVPHVEERHQTGQHRRHLVGQPSARLHVVASKAG